MASGRLAMLLAFAEPGSLQGRGREVLAMWRVGTLLDLRVAAYGLAPLYALGLAGCINGGAAWFFSAFQLVWSPFAYFAVSLVAVCNFFYYRTFHNEIDVSIFGVVNDGTRAVMTAVLRDYPSLRIILAAIASTALFGWITHGFWQVCKDWAPPTGVVMILLGVLLTIGFTFAYIIGMRGTLRRTPLRQRDRMVSSLPLLNKAVPNGLMALGWAITNYRDTPNYLPVPASEGKDLATAAIGSDCLSEKTPENIWLAKNPPHVVALIMEAFGSNMLEFDRPDETDLLGSFRPHLEEDFVFKRFLSEDNFTMPALARQFFFCPDESISRGKFKSIKLGGTPFDTFNQNGYDTVFLYPGHGSWHDLRQYLSLHDVGRTIFLTDFIDLLKNEKPDIYSDVSARGLPDEYVFPLVQKLLENSAKPMFIVVLTLTNHLPDKPPPSYKDRYPINPDEELLEQLSAQKSVKLDMLRGYQYANNCVGDFVSAIKNGPLADKTVIGAFGDHRVISLKAKHPEGMALDRAVPFYLYVPKPILAHAKHRYDPERVGSTKDIMPTLYGLSLSQASYYSVGGRNLLAEDDDPGRAFGYNARLFINADGACGVGEDYSGAWHTFAQGMVLGNDHQPIPTAVAEKISAYEKLYRWQINARVAGVRE
jgi:phosphoglycerol transferase MdoB-like AlkP superfamily enzyme